MKHDAVVDSARLDGALTATAEAIREKTGNTEPIPFDMDNGFKAAVDNIETGGDTEDAYNEGVEAGKKAEYDRFWDAYQNYGNRADYQNGFSGEGWTDETFKPKYDIVSNNNYMVFRRCGLKDLGATIRNSGKRVILLNHTMLQYTFQHSQQLEVIEGIEFTVPLKHITDPFAYCPKLRKIQTLPIAEDATQLNFTNIPALEDISFSGVLPVNISFAQSPKLTTESVQSIIDHLKDLTGATAQTLTFHATVGGKLTAEQKAAITSKNWTLVY